MDLKTQKWDQSYLKKENFIFFPKESVVKFLSRYVRRFVEPNEIKDIARLPSAPRALDLGCGIGRQTLLLDEFGFEAYGADISENAIAEAKKLFHSRGQPELCSRLTVLTNDQLPYENQFFDVVISDSVLDSMYFEHAKKLVKECARISKQFLFVTLIAGPPKEVEVNGDFESGTIQSYFDERKISELIAKTGFQISSLELVETRDLIKGFKNSRYYVTMIKGSTS